MKKILLITISNSLLASSAWIPLASGSLISHCNKDDYIRQNYIFLPPEYRPSCLTLIEFHDTLKNVDIIGLTCYVWNQDTNDNIAKTFKKYNPNGVVLYGGPNVPESFNDAMEYANNRKYVDHFFVGPGEKNLLNFLKFNKLEGTYNYEFFNITTNRSLYQISREETPTPFQEGIFDHVFQQEASVGAPVETTRGCPYSCAFCDWGGQSNSKIIKFEEEKIYKELLYMLKYDNFHYIDFTDANYGIFKRDLDIIKFICANKNKLKSVSFSGFAKNGTPILSEIIEELGNHFKMFLNEIKLSLQTMSDETLKTIKRSNIKTEKIISLMNDAKIKDKDKKSVSIELIIGLPGETAKSWLDTLCKTVELNVEAVKIHRLIVLTNTPINSQEYIKENNITFKKIKIPTKILNAGPIVPVLKKYHDIDNLNIYNDDINNLGMDEFKIVKNCNSFNDEELIEIHKMTFWYNTLIAGGFLKNHMLSLSIDLREQAEMFFNKIDEMPFFKSMMDYYINNIKKILLYDNDEYVIKTYGEYFCFMMNKSMENLKIYRNLNTAISEIKLVYPNASFNHIKTFTGLEDLKLASVHSPFLDRK